MASRKTLSCISPAGVGHFYRNADLHELRLALWEDEAPRVPSVADCLRQAGATVEMLLYCAGGLAPQPLPQPLPPLPPRDIARAFAPDGAIRYASHTPVPAFAWPELLRVDVAVLNLRDPAPLAHGLQAAGMPFVVYADGAELCAGHLPLASCVRRSDGPEALVSAVLIHTALWRAGLHDSPELTVAEMLPRLRALARFLVQDKSLADDLVADAMEEALALLPQMPAEKQTAALLVVLITRIWSRQTLSRPN